jgi:hypothetical protein
MHTGLHKTILVHENLKVIRRYAGVLLFCESVLMEIFIHFYI